MNLDRHISMTQITWIMGTLLGLVLAVLMGSAIGSQDFRLVTIVLGAGVGIATFLILGKNYWMLIPFSLGASFPAVPIGGRSLEFPEVAIAGCSLFFALRMASRIEKPQVFRTVKIPILLFVAWVGMVFMLNPVGLAMLGSGSGGGRFYIKLALAFAAFLMMSNREYTDRDIRWIFGLLIFGAFFSLAYGFASYATTGPQIDPTTGMVMDEFYTWHQLLADAPLTIAFLIFSRWSPREVCGLQRPFLMVVYFLCFCLILLSGKRMALLTILLAPLISAVLHKQFRYILISALLSSAILGVAIVGQGQAFSLPLVAQRTLSWLPGDWDPELQSMAGGTDEWRAELRAYATENIKRDPLIGRGFAVEVSETVAAIAQAKYITGTDMQTAAYALGRSWHNRWLGYAADFGIPMSIIQAIVYGWVLMLSYRVFKLDAGRSLMSVFAAYLIIYTVRDLAASWTSGHTAHDAFVRWWMYGTIVALYAQITSAARRLSVSRGAVTPIKKQPSPQSAQTGSL